MKHGNESSAKTSQILFESCVRSVTGLNTTIANLLHQTGRATAIRVGDHNIRHLDTKSLNDPIVGFLWVSFVACPSESSFKSVISDIKIFGIQTTFSGDVGIIQVALWFHRMSVSQFQHEPVLLHNASLISICFVPTSSVKKTSFSRFLTPKKFQS